MVYAAVASKRQAYRFKIGSIKHILSNVQVPVGTLLSRTGVQWWRSGETTHLSPMWPGFDSETRRRMLVLYSAPRGFLRVLWFSLSSKTNIWLDLL